MPQAVEEKKFQRENIPKTIKETAVLSASLESGIDAQEYKPKALSKQINKYTLKLQDKSLDEKYNHFIFNRFRKTRKYFLVVLLVIYAGYYSGRMLYKSLVPGAGCVGYGGYQSTWCEPYVWWKDLLLTLLGWALPLSVNFILTSQKDGSSHKWAEYSYSFSAIETGICLIINQFANGSSSPAFMLCQLILVEFSCHYFLKIKFIHTIFNFLVIGITFFVIECVAIGFEYGAEVTLLALFQFTCAAFLMACISYSVEFSLKFEFIHRSQDRATNIQLVKKLQDIDRQSQVNLNTPIMQAAEELKELISGAESAEDLSMVNVSEKLKNVLATLRSSDLLTPLFENDVRTGRIKYDVDTEKWLYTILPKSKSKSQDSLQISTNPIDAELRSSADLNEKPDRFAVAISSVIPSLSDNQIEDLQSKLTDSISSWDFNLFDLKILTNDHPLISAGLWIFSSTGLQMKFSIHTDTLISFLSNIAKGYKKSNAYHNEYHAADVLQAVHFLCEQTNVRSLISDEDRLAVYVAAIIHDFEHPGTNNSFQVESTSPIAMIYNDNSVLEQHHASAAFQTLLLPENNIVSALSPSAFKSFRQTVIDCVLATDLTHHFSLLSDFKRVVLPTKSLTDSLPPTALSDEGKRLVKKFLVKAGDISNPARPLEISLQWTENYQVESFAQGDLERSKGLKISPFMDRLNPKPALCQTRFMDFVAKPIWQLISEYFDISTPFMNLNSNYEYWKQKLAQE